jgi:hypothetical protein
MDESCSIPGTFCFAGCEGGKYGSGIGEGLIRMDA